MEKGRYVSAEDQRKRKRKSDYILLTIVGIILLYFALHMLAVASKLEPDTQMTLNVQTQLFIDGFVHGVKAPLEFGFPKMQQLPWISLSLLIALWLLVLFRIKAYASTHRHFQEDIAAGSAQWNDDLKGYNKKYTSPFGKVTNNGYDNMILTKNVFLSMNSYETRYNNHVMVVGGSGSGKSRFFVKPNILQANADYVVTDPAGELFASTAKFLKNKGYKISVFNLQNFKKSSHFNPWHYVKDDVDVFMLIRTLIANTTPPGANKGDPFWEKSEEALLQAIGLYMLHKAQEDVANGIPEPIAFKDVNFSKVMEYVRMANPPDDEGGMFGSAPQEDELSRIMDEWENNHPFDTCIKQWKAFKAGASKTLKSILISVSVRLAPFNLEDIANLTNDDEMYLESFGNSSSPVEIICEQKNDLCIVKYNKYVDRFRLEDVIYPYMKDGEFAELIEGGMSSYQFKLKDDLNYSNLVKDVNKFKDAAQFKGQALYLILPSSHSTYNFLAALLYSMMFITLYFKAETEKHGGSLDRPVRFLLDEFANIANLPEFEKKLATMRKYGMSCSIILQNISQLKAMYREHYEDIIGNCDSFLYLGGQEKETATYVSDLLGTSTIRGQSMGGVGSKGSPTYSYSNTNRKLLLPDEVARIPNNKCILLIRSLNPFFDFKYDYTQHPNYKYTGDSDKKELADDKFFDLIIIKHQSSIEHNVNREKAIGKNIGTNVIDSSKKQDSEYRDEDDFESMDDNDLDYSDERNNNSHNDYQMGYDNEDDEETINDDEESQSEGFDDEDDISPQERYISEQGMWDDFDENDLNNTKEMSNASNVSDLDDFRDFDFEDDDEKADISEWYTDEN